MPPPPNPVRIFHITAIANLAKIATGGALRAKGWLAANGVQYSNIAYQGAQGRRASKRVPLPPGGVIHDYVPFYFAPRSPMLLTIDGGNVPDCPHRQSDIVHFATSAEKIFAAPLPAVFYNYNATLDIAECFSSPPDLSNIEWPLFFESPQIDGYCKYWHNVRDKPRYVARMETRQAEFLVHESVPLTLIQGIGVHTQAKADEVKAILAQHSCALPVVVKPGWYF